MASLVQYRSLEKGQLDPEEIRRLVAKSKDAGLIQVPGCVKILKNGTAATTAGTVISQWMDVDPGLAAHWLQNNVRNRPLADDTIIAYARDMRNGEWAETHQGLAFNDRDELIDGQHRLHAIIRAGVTVRMMVTFGLKSEIKGKEVTTMDAVDRGRPRSVADQLKIQHGLKDGSKIAMICASLACLCQSERTRRLSVGQTLEIYRAFQPSISWVIQFAAKDPGLRAKGVAAACAFAIAAAPKLKDACHRLYTGESLSPGSPLHQLREFLVSDDAKLLNRGSDRALADLVLEAIHLHIAGVTVPRLELGQTGRKAFQALQQDRVRRIAEMFELSR
jgi:hypothetical protein